MRAAPSFHSRMIPAGSVTTMASADSFTTAAASHSSVTPATLEPVSVIVLPPSLTPHLIPHPIAGHLRSGGLAYAISNTEYNLQGGTCPASPAGVLRAGDQGTHLPPRGAKPLPAP